MDRKQGDAENQFPKRGELASIGLIGAARLDQKRYMEHERQNTATMPAKEQPRFRNLQMRLEKLLNMSRDIERRSNEISSHMFGPVPEEDPNDFKIREPNGMMQAFDNLLDETFFRLNGVEKNLNRLHHELGSNED